MNGLETAEGLLEFAKAHQQVLKDMLLLTGKVPFFCLLVINRNPDTGERLTSPGIFDMQTEGFRDEEEKRRMVEQVRWAAEKLDATGVIWGMEAWSLVMDRKDQSLEDAEQEADRIKAAHGGSLKNHPQRREIVMLYLEHRQLGVRMWQAEIKRGKQRPWVKTFEELPVESDHMGLFVNLLPVVN